MKLPSTSSRESPIVVWVRSLVPKEKKSAWWAMWPAIRHARGSSIIVPTEYGTSLAAPRRASSATLTTCSRSWRSSVS